MYDVLEQKGICFGIDQKKISWVVSGQQYMQMVMIAAGEPARNGEDGHIKDYYPRKAQIKYASKGNGGIDFKSTNLIHNVKKGDVVYKYGEIIGIATVDIKTGDYVHVHNIESTRGRGDKK